MLFLFSSLCLIQYFSFAMEYFPRNFSEGVKYGLGLDLKKARSQSCKKLEEKKQAAVKEKRTREDEESDGYASSSDEELQESQDSAKQDEDEKKKSCIPAQKRSRYDGTRSSHVQVTSEEQREIDRRIKEAELFRLIDKQS